MALSWSTGLRNFAALHGSYRQALEGGVLEIRTGSAPATADAAVTGTLLCRVSLASGAVTPEAVAKSIVVLSGSGGYVTSITVNGVDILGKQINWDTDLSTTTLAVVSQINRYFPPAGGKYMAWAPTPSNGQIWLYAMPGTGTTPNGYAVVCNATTMGGTASSMGTAGTSGTGVANVNGLPYGDALGGVLDKGTGVWSGVNLTTGVAGYFRLIGAGTDGGTAGSHSIRVQGVCGVASGDYPMTSTTLTAGQTHTVDTFTLTLPAA